MYKYFLKKSIPALLICCLLLFLGCDKESETKKQPEVVVKKIVVPKKKIPPQKVAVKPQSVEMKVKQQAAAKKVVEKEKPVVQKTAGKEKPVTKPSRMITMASISRTPIPTKLSDIVRGYDPRGKIDPFDPLLKPEPVKKDEKTKVERKKCIASTPLQKSDLSQFELVAVILKESGNRALVVEPSGKGYVLEKNTPIGIHCGHVVEIMKESLIVEEEVEDLYGEVTKQKRELKIQKPLGE